MCKQLNGPVLKSLKTKRPGQNGKIKLAGPGPKFCISFRAGPGLGRNFNFSFGPGWAQTKISIFLSVWARPKFFSLFWVGLGRTEIAARRTGPEKPGLCRPLLSTTSVQVCNLLKIKHPEVSWQRKEFQRDIGEKSGENKFLLKSFTSILLKSSRWMSSKSY